MRFVVLQNNLVSNIIIADSKADAELATNAICVEIDIEDDVDFGYTFDPENKIFKSPATIFAENLENGEVIE
jgi:hypothetical protein